MKLNVLTFGVYLSSSCVVYGEVIEGSMSCTVKSQYIVEIEEGKPKQYLGFKDSFEVGDVLSFKYSYAFEQLYVGLKDVSNNEIVIDNSANLLLSKKRVSPNSVFIEFLESEIYFSSNFIRIVTEFSGELSLERYYKGDWNGVYTLASFIPPNIFTQVASLDCKHVSGDLGDIANGLYSLYGDEEN